MGHYTLVKRNVSIAWMLGIAIASAGCVADVGDGEAVGLADEEIFRGPQFSNEDVEGKYPEFVVLNMDGAACSAVLLDSQLILTAAHCRGTNMKVTRVGIGVHNVDRVVWWNHTDILLGHLDRPIYTGPYAELEPMQWVGDTVTYTGRIDHGTITNRGNMIRSRTISYIDANFARTNWRVLQPGDSGGGVFLDYSHRLVGVNAHVVGAEETPGSWDGFARITPGMANAIRDEAAKFGGPGTNVRIHVGRTKPF